MNNFIMLDLKSYYNHKIIYNEPPILEEEDFATDNLYILRSDFDLEERIMLDGILFSFSAIEFDCFECSGQHIKVDAIVDKLHIIGFSCWGDSNVLLKIIYEDSSVEYLNVTIIECMRGVNIDFEHVLVTSPISAVPIRNASQSIYIHHFLVRISNKSRVREIVLPNNDFVRIFAMTLENENCHIEKQNQED